jgi:hypothetical protein
MSLQQQRHCITPASESKIPQAPEEITIGEAPPQTINAFDIEPMPIPEQIIHDNANATMAGQSPHLARNSLPAGHDPNSNDAGKEDDIRKHRPA